MALAAATPPLGRGRITARRVPTPSEIGRGYEALWYFCDDLAVMVAQRSLEAEQCFNYIGEGLLKLHFRLAGTSMLRFPGEDASRISGLFCGAMIHPMGLPKVELCEQSDDDRWVTIFCRPAVFSNVLGLDSTDLPGPVADFAKGVSTDLVRAQIPMENNLVIAANALAQLDPAVATDRVWAEAKVVDMLCGALNSMRLVRDDCATLPLTQQDTRRIEDAKIILLDSYANPPSLKALAHMVGLNRNKLNQGFKQHVGQTVGNFLLQVRMHKARELLENGDLQVTQVAYEVGYEFPSNFATSFKRYFGYPPKRLRRRII